MQTTREPTGRLARYALIATNIALGADIIYQSGAVKLLGQAGSSLISGIARNIPSTDHLSSAAPYLVFAGAVAITICDLLRKDDPK